MDTIIKVSNKYSEKQLNFNDAIKKEMIYNNKAPEFIGLSDIEAKFKDSKKITPTATDDTDPSVTYLSPLFDSNFVDVSFRLREVTITGKKVGTSEITFRAQDQYQKIGQKKIKVKVLPLTLM